MRRPIHIWTGDLSWSGDRGKPYLYKFLCEILAALYARQIEGTTIYRMKRTQNFTHTNIKQFNARAPGCECGKQRSPHQTEKEAHATSSQPSCGQTGIRPVARPPRRSPPPLPPRQQQQQQHPPGAATHRCQLRAVLRARGAPGHRRRHVARQRVSARASMAVESCCGGCRRRPLPMPPLPACEAGAAARVPRGATRAATRGAAASQTGADPALRTALQSHHRGCPRARCAASHSAPLPAPFPRQTRSRGARPAAAGPAA